MPDSQPAPPALTTTQKVQPTSDQEKVLKYSRSVRKQLRTWIGMLSHEIKSIERRVAKRGGPSSEQGKDLIKLKRSITALHMANSSFRNEIRAIERPGAGKVLHANFIRTPEGIVACGPKLHDGISLLVDSWLYEGSNSFDNLEHLGIMSVAMLRAAAIMQEGIPALADMGIEAMQFQCRDALASVFASNWQDMDEETEAVFEIKNFIKGVHRIVEKTKAQLAAAETQILEDSEESAAEVEAASEPESVEPAAEG